MTEAAEGLPGLHVTQHDLLVGAGTREDAAPRQEARRVHRALAVGDLAQQLAAVGVAEGGLLVMAAARLVGVGVRVRVRVRLRLRLRVRLRLRGRVRLN